MTDNERIQAAFRAATELADEVPDVYRLQAFAIAARQLLGGSPEADPTTRGTRGQATESPASLGTGDSPALEAWAVRVVEGLPDAGLVVEHGDRRHLAMFGVVSLLAAGKAASTDSVRSYLKNKLGVTPESASHTSDRLKGMVPRFLSRDPAQEGRGFDYKPTARALEIFDDLPQ